MVLILMGVTGCGKSTVGRALAERLACPFFDADDYHPDSNRLQMASGVPLTDKDRAPWLDRLAERITEWNGRYPQVVLACSALKQSYRDRLDQGGPVRWVYLKGDRELIQKRLAGRQGHFMNPALLDSQFSILEEPDDAIVVEISTDIGTIMEVIQSQLEV
jgi:gluconokinase